VGRTETEPKEPKTMTTGRDHDDEGPVELIVRPWDRPGEAKLYVKPVWAITELRCF
jgi:hypothetical protein